MFYQHKLILLLSIFFTVFIFSCKEDEPTKKETIKPQQVFVAPTDSSSGRLNIRERVCYFSDVDSAIKRMNIILDSADSREIEIVNNIMQYAGLPSNFDIFRGNIDNAMATVVNQRRLIIYNKDLFKIIDKLSNSYWSSVFIMAHEIGHHLAYNISDTVNTIKAELDADIFAASILYKMGADTNQVIQAVNSRFISNETDTKTHPSKSKRIAAIRESWRKADKLGMDMATPPAPYDQGEDVYISKEELWDNPNTKIELMNMPIKVSSNISAVVLSVDYSKYGREKIEQDRNFQVLLLITGISDDSKNELEFKINERRKIDVCYTPFGSDGEDPDYVLRYFCAGRRIVFTAYEYHDNMSSNERIVDVKNGK